MPKRSTSATIDRPSRTAKGFLKICKQAEAADPLVTGTFQFTVAAVHFTSSRTLAVGKCTTPIKVPAGSVTVSEAARSPYQVSDIEVSPPDRLINSDLGNRTAIVAVPASTDTSTETTVTFENTTTGQVNVCKALTGTSGALAGQTFTFDVSTSAAGNGTISVVAGQAGSTACGFYPVALPVGSTVSISEQGQPNGQVVGVSVSPSSNDNGSTATTANLKVGSGITTATFTNQAMGSLEICKAAADPTTATQTFQFSLNGGPPISVHAGQCTQTIAVPAGTATVYELPQTSSQLQAVSANQGRLISGPTDNPATVSVPFGDITNETVVTFTNVQTGQFQICKKSPAPALQTTAFDFTYWYQMNGSMVTGSMALMPGQCSGLSSAITVVDPGGDPIPIYVTESPTPSTQVSTIAVTGSGHVISKNLANRTATISVGPGVTAVTYTNLAKAPTKSAIS